MENRKKISLFKCSLLCLVGVFVFTLVSVDVFRVKDAFAQQMGLPAPGVMLSASKPYSPVVLRGLKIDDKDPFKFDFIVETGDTGLNSDNLQEDANQLIQYFMASLTVPAGFTMSSYDVKQISQKRSVPVYMYEQISKEVKAIEDSASLDKSRAIQYGETENLMLLAVRSSPYESAPGKHLTVNKVGLHSKNLDAYAQEIRNPYRARFDYIKFISDYIFHIDGLETEYLQFYNILYENNFGEEDYTLDDMGRLDALVLEVEQRYKNITGRDFPDPTTQLNESILAVADSYEKDVEGDAVIVEWNVLGNIDDDKSLSGVLFSRNPFNGEKELTGNYLFSEEGTAVVSVGFNGELDRGANTANRHEEKNYEEFRVLLPQVYVDLKKHVDKAEKHFRTALDMEIVVSAGKLFFVQSRDNFDAMPPIARARVLVDLSSENVISEIEALDEIPLEDLEWIKYYLKQPIVKDSSRSKILIKGIPLVPGVVTAKAHIGDPALFGVEKESIAVVNAVVEGFVADKPNKQYISYEKVFKDGVVGVLAVRGGFADHASVIIRRENRRIPYIVCNTSNLTEDNKLLFDDGELFISEGDLITLDANTGSVYKGLTDYDFGPSEVTRVLNGELSPENSDKYRCYKKVLEWIKLKQDKNASSAIKDSFVHADAQVVFDFLKEAYTWDDELLELLDEAMDSLVPKDMDKRKEYYFGLVAQALVPELTRLSELAGYSLFDYINAALESLDGDIAASLKNFLLKVSFISMYDWRRTSFFRGAENWELDDGYLKEIIISKVSKNDLYFRTRHIGSASGKEAYSVAMMIHRALKKFYEENKKDIGLGFNEWIEKWDIQIDAFDRQLYNLAKTKAGVYRGLNDDDKFRYKFHDSYIQEYVQEHQAAYRVLEILRGWVNPIYIDFSDKGQLSRFYPKDNGKPYDISFAQNSLFYLNHNRRIKNPTERIVRVLDILLQKPDKYPHKVIYSNSNFKYNVDGTYEVTDRLREYIKIYLIKEVREMDLGDEHNLTTLGVTGVPSYLLEIGMASPEEFRDDLNQFLRDPDPELALSAQWALKNLDRWKLVDKETISSSVAEVGGVNMARLSQVVGGQQGIGYGSGYSEIGVISGLRPVIFSIEPTNLKLTIGVFN